MDWLVTYKRDGIQGRDLGVEAQTFREPAHFLGDILSTSRLGAIEDQGAAGVRCTRHGGCLCEASSACKHEVPSAGKSHGIFFRRGALTGRDAHSNQRKRPLLEATSQ